MIRKKGQKRTFGRRARDVRAVRGPGEQYLRLRAADFSGLLKCGFFFQSILWEIFLLEICNNLKKLADEPHSLGIPKRIKK